jgi:hypothetical protein
MFYEDVCNKHNTNEKPNDDGDNEGETNMTDIDRIVITIVRSMTTNSCSCALID